MQIQTGKGTIPLMTLLAIWSISLTVNLPGLAVSPMLGTLEKIFPSTTPLEAKLLTSLPNLFIIPFVLLAGKLSLSKSKIALLVWALVIFLISGVAYMFAQSMLALIVISCTLGIGCGLLIPLAAGLLSDTFVGRYRMTQLGIKSAISNISLVAATFVVGWLCHSSNWRMPFLVYLIPLVPLALTPFLRGIPKSDLELPSSPVSEHSEPKSPEAKVPAAKPADVKAPAAQVAAQTAPKRAGKREKVVSTDTTDFTIVSGLKVTKGFYLSRLWPLLAVYFFVCYAAIVVSYDIPFLATKDGISTAEVGVITSIFFLGMFLPGLLLSQIVRIFKQTTLPLAAVAMAVGLGMIVVFHAVWVYCVASFLIGWGMGVFQPLIYDKGTQTVVNEYKATLALAYVLTANYLSISAAPFIVDFFAKIFGQSSSAVFPFLLNFCMVVIFLAIVIIFRKRFVFKIDESYYKNN